MMGYTQNRGKNGFSKEELNDLLFNSFVVGRETQKKKNRPLYESGGNKQEANLFGEDNSLGYKQRTPEAGVKSVVSLAELKQALGNEMVSYQNRKATNTEFAPYNKGGGAENGSFSKEDLNDLLFNSFVVGKEVQKKKNRPLYETNLREDLSSKSVANNILESVLGGGYRSKEVASENYSPQNQISSKYNSSFSEEELNDLLFKSINDSGYLQQDKNIDPYETDARGRYNLSAKSISNSILENILKVSPLQNQISSGHNGGQHSLGMFGNPAGGIKLYDDNVITHKPYETKMEHNNVSFNGFLPRGVPLNLNEGPQLISLEASNAAKNMFKKKEKEKNNKIYKEHDKATAANFIEDGFFRDSKLYNISKEGMDILEHSLKSTFLGDMLRSNYDVIKSMYDEYQKLEEGVGTGEAILRILNAAGSVILEEIGFNDAKDVVDRASQTVVMIQSKNNLMSNLISPKTPEDVYNNNVAIVNSLINQGYDAGINESNGTLYIVVDGKKKELNSSNIKNIIYGIDAEKFSMLGGLSTSAYVAKKLKKIKGNPKIKVPLVLLGIGLSGAAGSAAGSYLDTLSNSLRTNEEFVMREANKKALDTFLSSLALSSFSTSVMGKDALSKSGIYQFLLEEWLKQSASNDIAEQEKRDILEHIRNNP